MHQLVSMFLFAILTILVMLQRKETHTKLADAEFKMFLVVRLMKLLHDENKVLASRLKKRERVPESRELTGFEETLDAVEQEIKNTEKYFES